MSRRTLIAANWKMHKTLSEAEAFADALNQTASWPEHVEFCVGANALVLTSLVSKMPSVVSLAAQNVYFEDKGAFTGEISAGMLAAIGLQYCIVGHSERRQIFGESSEIVAKKARALLNNQITPILCVGETLQERESGNAEAIVVKQLTTSLAMVKSTETLVIAYEPVWAIGTGKTATPEDAQTMHAAIRKHLIAQFDAEFAERTLLLYGGSVKPHNAGELLSRADIDGALVGGASLESKSFLAIGASAAK